MKPPRRDTPESFTISKGREETGLCGLITGCKDKLEGIRDVGDRSLDFVERNNPSGGPATWRYLRASILLSTDPAVVTSSK